MEDARWLTRRANAACNLLSPDPKLAEECRRCVAGEIREINEIELMRVVGSRHANKEAKVAAKKLAAAIRRVELAIAEFQPFTGRHWNRMIDVSSLPLDALARVRGQAQDVALRQSPVPARADRQMIMMAVSSAKALFTQFGRGLHPTKRQIGELAATLIGSQADLSRYVPKWEKPGAK